MDKILKNKTLVIIAGPTAVGKTALSIKLAKHYKTEIISADSRQLFKELSIGTAKPTHLEMEGVAHHLIDSHSIQDAYNVGIYENEVLAHLEKLFEKQDITFLVGGSGLYIKAVCEGLDELPKVLPEIRSKLNEEFENEGLANLVAELKAADPEYFQTVDLQNPQRIIRALEVIRSTGMPFSSFRSSSIKKRPFQIIKIGIGMERNLLYQRIDARMDDMLRNGLVDEARQLFAYKELNALKTVGYEEIFDFMEGKEDWEQTVFLLKRNSRRYAKRQMTWFKKDANFRWFEPTAFAEIVSAIDDLTV